MMKNNHFRKSCFGLLCLCVLACVLYACAKPEPSSVIVTLSPQDAKDMMDKQPCLIVDVRTRQEYAERHIPGAVNIPLDEIGGTIPEEIQNALGPVLLYCRSGRRSRQAAERLEALGMESVYDFGGINDWPYETVSSQDEEAVNPVLMLDHHEQTDTDGILFEVTGFEDNVLIALITNQTDAVCEYGEPFEVKVKDSGEWKQVPWEDEPVWIEVAWQLAPGDSAEVRCSLSLLKTIDSGEYMLVKGGLETPFTLVYSE